MTGFSPGAAAFGKGCGREGCDNFTPWDMPAVFIDTMTVCCSPDCALIVLEGSETVPETIALHDPQFTANRDALDLPSGVIDIWREVKSREEAEEAIREIAALHGGRFRVSPGGGENL